MRIQGPTERSVRPVDSGCGSRRSFVGNVCGKAETIIDAEGKEQTVEAETVVQAVGYTPNNALYTALEAESTVPVWNIGDSKVHANVMEAVRAGWFVAKKN